MFCAYCGAKLEDNSMFCSNCGNKVATEEQANVTTEQVSNDIEEKQTHEEEQPVNELGEQLSNEQEQQPVNELGEQLSNEQEEQPANELEEQLNYEQEQQPDANQVEQLVIEQEDHVEPKEQESLSAPSMQENVCKTCGAVLDHDSVFCSNCGSPVAKPSFEQPVTSPIVEQPNSVSEPREIKKKKKGLFIAIIIAAVLLLGTGGLLIYSKITLGKLGDSVEAFKELVSENGLDDIDEYEALIKEAEEKASGWLFFGAADMEKRLEEATIECEQLSKDLVDLTAKRDSYASLDETLILDFEQQDVIDEYLYDFDAAIEVADTKKAEEVLASLEQEKTAIIEENKLSADTTLTELYDYYNYSCENFTTEDEESFYSQVSLIESAMDELDFVKARDLRVECFSSISSIVERIEQEQQNALYAKPEELTIMISGLMYNDAAFRDEFEKALEAEVGIDITFDLYDEESYYDALDTNFAAGTAADIVFLDQDLYKAYQYDGYLADITDYWNGSELLTSSNFYGEEVMENLKIDGRLYGFSPVRGISTVTYIRKSWLDELGLSVPTTYDEFYQMLTAFTENKMGGGKNATYGMTAAGFLTSDEPYTSFLQPFYQKAVAEIYQNSSGEWVDGFVQPEMVDALYRLQEAYKLGYLDQDMADRTADDAIIEFGAGRCGVISLWEGHGANYLIDELAKNGIEDDIIVMEPLQEMGGYLQAEPPVFAITTNCENPGGVMKYFFEPMLDGKAVQKLWTYGVEGYHWEMINDGPNQGLLATLPYDGTVDYTYNYNVIDPLRSLAAFEDGDPGVLNISDLAANSVAIADQYYVPSPKLKYNETYWYSFWDIQAAREEAIKKVVLEGVDPNTALEEYKANVQYTMDQVLSEMNQY